MSILEIGTTSFSSPYNPEAMAAIAAMEQSVRADYMESLLMVYPSIEAQDARLGGDGAPGVAALPRQYKSCSAEARLAAQTDPCFGAWIDAVHARIRETGEHPSSANIHKLAADARYLGNVTVAAMLYDQDGPNVPEIVVREHDEHVVIPGFGSTRLPGSEQATVRIEDGTIHFENNAGSRHRVDELSAQTPAWWVVPRLTSGDMRVTLNYLDPYRNVFAAPLSRAVNPEKYEHWAQMFDEAWQLLAHNPAVAEYVRNGLQSIIPAPKAPLTQAKSMANSAMFGAIGISEPTDPARLASHLVNGSLKNALLQIRTQLPDFCHGHYDPGAMGVRYIPGRDVPGVASHLLDDAFLATGLANYFVGMIDHPELPPAYVEMSLLRWYMEGERCLRVLRTTNYLKPNGEKLATMIGDTLRQLEPFARNVSEDAKAAITTNTIDHYLSWRMHWLTPTDTAINSLASTWHEGSPPSAPTVYVSRPGNPEDKFGFIGQRNRYVLAEIRRKEPWLFADLQTPDGLERHVAAGLLANVQPGDVSFAAGDLEKASQQYLQAIRGNPEDREAWIGWMLTLAHQNDDMAPAITANPELAFHLYNKLGDPSTDPKALVSWLAPLGDDHAIATRYGFPDLLSA